MGPLDFNILFSNKRKYDNNLDNKLISENESEIILEADTKKKTFMIKDN